MSRIGFITERMRRGFGVDLAVDRLAQGLAACGHDVTVYASVSDGTFRPAGYRIQLIPTRASSFFPRSDLAAQRHLSFLNGEGNQIWLLQTPPFFSLLPHLEAPAVVVDYGVSSSQGFPAKIRANFAYLKFTQDHLFWRKARAITPISEFLWRELPERLQSKARVIYLGADHYGSAPGGADAGAADAGELRGQLGVGDDEVLLLYVGRLASADQPYKGTAELVQAYHRLRAINPKLRLLMVGFGRSSDCQRLRDQGVLVIGDAPAEQMPQIFRACDIYVTASRWEGFDLPLVEAQSFGRPVVALNVGAHPEVVDDGKSGYLAADMAELERAVERLAEDAELRTAAGRAARAVADRFKWSYTVAAYDQLIGDVLNTPH